MSVATRAFRSAGPSGNFDFELRRQLRSAGGGGGPSSTSLAPPVILLRSRFLLHALLPKFFLFVRYFLLFSAVFLSLPSLTSSSSFTSRLSTLRNSADKVVERRIKDLQAKLGEEKKNNWTLKSWQEEAEEEEG